MASADPRRARFESLYVLVRDPLLRYFARRAPVDAVEDLLADTFLVLWRRLDDVPGGGELPWSYGVARRILANRRRSASLAARMVAPFGITLDPRAPDERYGADPTLAAAIARLAPLDAEIVRLWAWEELAPREIAAALELSANAVSIRLTRAKARLRELLAEAPR